MEIPNPSNGNKFRSSLTRERIQSCPTPGCDGLGNRNAKFMTHRSINSCPLSDRKIVKTSKAVDSRESSVKKPGSPLEKPGSPLEKPGSPLEKLAPPLSTQLSALNLGSNESLDESLDSLPNTSISTKSSAPVILGKKPKVVNSGIPVLQRKPKSVVSSTPITTSVGPDVVPQENGSKLDKDKDRDEPTIKLNNSSTEFDFSSFDAMTDKLIHLTCQRPKGPSSRRPSTKT